jgi:hypothetical protein
VPEPANNFLFPCVVSYMGGNRSANDFLRGADRVQCTPKIRCGVPEMNLKGEPTPDFKFRSGPAQ